jgi:hypothetical protein
MILTEYEQLIIRNMSIPSIRMGIVGESYKNLSDGELISLIDKMDDHINEIGETKRAFGDYDEFYKIELTHTKSRLVEEFQKRKIKNGVKQSSG